MLSPRFPESPESDSANRQLTRRPGVVVRRQVELPRGSETQGGGSAGAPSHDSRRVGRRLFGSVWPSGRTWGGRKEARSVATAIVGLCGRTRIVSNRCPRLRSNCLRVARPRLYLATLVFAMPSSLLHIAAPLKHCQSATSLLASSLSKTSHTYYNVCPFLDCTPHFVRSLRPHGHA